MRSLILAALAGLSLVAGCARKEPPPIDTPATYAEIVSKAREEGALSIYTNTDAAEAEPLLNAFRAKYPGIRIDYADQSSVELYSRYVAEVAAGQGTADILWSSAMDLQFKLAADGYALPYKSTEASAVPAWAQWEDKIYATTREPIVIAYNKRMLPAADVPTTHADLVRVLERDPEAFVGKVGLLDPERSGVGFLYYSNDLKASPVAREMLDALGPVDPKLYSSNGAVLERLASGEHSIAYNMIGSYMLKRQKKDPNIGVVFPSDYTMTMSRLVLISRESRHPNAARLFVDFLLSPEGQRHLSHASMAPIRTDMGDGGVGLPPADRLRPIQVNRTLLEELNPQQRLSLLSTWRTTVRDRR